jgi:hypothetical protein
MNVRVIEQVERFRSEIQPAWTAVRNVLHDTKIDIDKARRSKRVSP